MRTLQGAGENRAQFPDWDEPGSAGYSPAYTADGINSNPVGNPPELTNHLAPANAEEGDWDEPINPNLGSFLPPDPSLGGEPGRTNQLGWTRGLRPFRWSRAPLDGKVIVVPSMGAHPAVGPVGFSTRSQRLANGVAELTASRLPNPSVIADSFVNPDVGTYGVGD